MREFYTAGEDLRSLFAGAWCGPDQFRPHEPTLIAKMAKGNADGFDVEVYCTATPAMFFEVRAMAGVDGVGNQRMGFVLTTGSGMGRFALEFAKLAVEGMLDVRTAEMNAHA